MEHRVWGKGKMKELEALSQGQVLEALIQPIAY